MTFRDPCCTFLPQSCLQSNYGAQEMPASLHCVWESSSQPLPARGWDRTSHKQPVLGASSYSGKEKGCSSSSSPAHFSCQWRDFLVRALSPGPRGRETLNCPAGGTGCEPNPAEHSEPSQEVPYQPQLINKPFIDRIF